MTGPEKRTPEELQADIEAIREELGGTVEELAHRADVPARVRAKREETVARVRQQVERAQEKVPALSSAVRRNPVYVGGGALLVAVLAFLAVRGRSRS